ncbi:hypothetical protein AB1Y20_001416 [Prymnesium parvum]|uniref:Uncharacterized protein n=1 Tax=Prymnesium parvum TaxID=97485 RepID=A0AB34KDM9_PRYPA
MLLQPLGEPPPVARLRAWLDRTDATMLPREALSDAVAFSSDCCSLSGAAAYASAAERWAADGAALLPPFHTSHTRCALLPDGALVVRWRAEWEPETLPWAPAVASLFQWDIKHEDLDPYAASTFRWRALGRLLFEAAATSTLRLPASFVEGTAVFTLDERGTHVISHKERIDLVGLADSGRLLNRRCAQDCALFLDVCRRPDSVDPDDWAARVRSRVLARVPGAGVLDVEPGDDAEGAFAIGAFAIVALGVAGCIASAIAGDARGVDFADSARTAMCEQMMATIGSKSSQAYLQCISDLF